MTHAIRVLHLEHENLTKLFDVMESQLRELDDGKAPDFPLLSDIADYFTGFPDQVHHPKEDVIFRKLTAGHPAVVESMVNLVDEHEDLSELVEKFASDLKQLQSSPETPVDDFVDSFRSLLDHYRHHMQMEEQYFFPKAVENLTQDEWAEVNFAISEQDDPLFDEAAEKYRKIRNAILQLAALHEETAELQALSENASGEVMRLSSIAQFNDAMRDKDSAVRLVRNEDGGFRLHDGDQTLAEIPKCSERRAAWCAWYFLKGIGR
jgi:hemerythrin-like domain-containing protein